MTDTEQAQTDSPAASMPFLSHLEELRKVLLWCLLAVGIGAAACWWLSEPVLEWLISKTAGETIFMRPHGAFLARLKVAIVLGLLTVLPFVFYKTWNFVGPGLLEVERRFVLPGVIFSLMLFYSGLAFSYFVLTPLTVRVLLGYEMQGLTATTEITYLLDLVFTLGIGCGLVFQLPLAMSFLTVMGIITPQFLLRYWRHAVVIIVVVAALLTPADPISQIFLAVPLVLLYGISFLLSKVIYRNKNKQKEQ